MAKANGIYPGSQTPLRLRIASKKFRNISNRIKTNVLIAIRTMRSPLIATHLRPDEDAIGSAIALAIYLKKEGNNPAIFLRENERVPKLLQQIIETEQINIVHSTRMQPHDGLIMVDTAGEKLLEDPVKDLKQGRIKPVDIDHHLGEELLAPVRLSLITNRVSSTAEIIADLIRPEITGNMAKALLAGIMTDTKRLNFMVGSRTRLTVARLERTAGMDKDAIYDQLKELSDADRYLVAHGAARAHTASVTVAGKLYTVKWLVVKKDALDPENRNWRKPIQEELGFGQKADIVLIVYYDTTKGKHRGSLGAYHKGTEIDFRPTAEAISHGGGHPGAVGFDLNLETFDGDLHAVHYILSMLTLHGKTK